MARELTEAELEAEYAREELEGFGDLEDQFEALMDGSFEEHMENA
jgi:hypothetical protein